MNPEKDFIKAQIANLQLRLAEIDQQEPAKVELWQPKGGRFFVASGGNPRIGTTSDSTRNFGVEFKTVSQSKIAAEIMRRHNRTLCYVFEHEPDWGGSGKYSIEHFGGKFHIINAINNVVGRITMPKHVAEKLAADLNSGRVVL